MAQKTDSKKGNKKSTKQSSSDKSQKRSRRSRRGGVRRGKPISGTKTVSYPVTRENVMIDHPAVAHAFDHHFEGFRSAFFGSMSVMRRFGLDEGADQIHSYIGELIDDASTEVSRATKAIQKLIVEKGGPKEVPRTTPTQYPRSAEVPAFVVRRYLRLFGDVDRLVDAVITAENHGAISWSKRASLLRDAPRYLRTPAGRFTSVTSKLFARQKKDQNNQENAKANMQKTIDEILAEHRDLKNVSEKRPLRTGKTGTDD